MVLTSWGSRRRDQDPLREAFKIPSRDFGLGPPPLIAFPIFVGLGFVENVVICYQKAGISRISGGLRSRTPPLIADPDKQRPKSRLGILKASLSISTVET